MDLGLGGRIALVSGSWRGTGAGIAEALAREGATVAVHGFEPGQADPVAARLCEAGFDAHAVDGDIRRDEGARTLAEQIDARFGRVDVLVNNYGVAERGRWFTSSTDDWVDVYQSNVLSGVRLVHAFAPGMRERGWGRIVWLGTIGSTRPGPRMPHYYASKAALPNVCVSLAKELAGSGVTVNLVSPGLIATDEVVEMLKRRPADDPGGGARISQVSEVASLVAYLCGEPAAAIHGANLRIDGGATDVAL